MTVLFHSSPSIFFTPTCLFKPKTPSSSSSSSSSKPPLSITTTIPAARNRVIDFGKYKGRMLGNLSTVAELLEVSERFGWDNNDKVVWSRVNFELLDTSKGGRIPRLCKDGGKKEMGKEMGRKVEAFSEREEKRRERRERLRVRREVGKEGKLGIVEKDGVYLEIQGIGEEKEEVRYKRNNEDAKDGMVENWKNPFPGREALLKKVLNLKRYLFAALEKLWTVRLKERVKEMGGNICFGSTIFFSKSFSFPFKLTCRLFKHMKL